MIFNLLKKYEMPVLLFLGLLCFVISLGFYNVQIPGDNIILTASFTPGNLLIQRNAIRLEAGTDYRVSSYYKRAGRNNDRPDIKLKIEQSKSVAFEELLITHDGHGSGEGDRYSGYNNYGLFSVPSSGDYRLSIKIKDYPKDYKTLKIFISKDELNTGRNLFILAGLMILVIFIIRIRKAKA